ncbi:hypothetical protein [Sellimonas intestinalis]|uniref:hypothetical protein n=1 Tax=Sellimonas intestinalis TaxID=1653434 RepID=UPI0015EBE8AC|nr:hypothetical protein [Sellimonas intestinalis]MBA2214172.1 hypothetical protein [Sellimonas intestinalis]
MYSSDHLTEELLERTWKLKYFYLVDIDTLIQNIKVYINEHKNDTGFHIFHGIFDTLYRFPECNSYFQFLTSPRSFNFSTSQNNQFLFGCQDVLQFLLRNHCILYGFDQLLNQTDSDEIRISSKSDKGKTAPYANPNNLAQNYNKYKKRFQQKSDNYSYYFLKRKYCLENPLKKDFGFPTVLKHNEHLARFIFTNPSIPTFDKHIGQTRSLKYYSDLYNEIMLTRQFLSEMDSFIFNYSTEYLYGFYFFRSVFKLLDFIYGPKTGHLILENSDFKISLKELAGDITLNLISQVARLPITYNRYFLLQYILYHLISSEKLERDIRPRNKHALFAQIPSVPSSNFQLILDGLSRAGYYIQNLNYILFPFLEDLWYVITNHFPEIDLQTYEQYITSNSDILTFDFSSCKIQDFEEIHQVCKEETKEKFYKKLRENPDSFPNALSMPDSAAKAPAIKLLADYLAPSRIDDTPKDITELLFQTQNNFDSQTKFLKSEHLNALFEFTKQMPT